MRTSISILRSLILGHRFSNAWTNDFSSMMIIVNILNGRLINIAIIISRLNKMQNEVLLSLMQSLEGPQDIEIELSMTVYKDGQPRGTNVQRIFIIVSEFSY